MDIRAFVYQVVDIFPGPLKTPARWVADRVFGVWNDVSAVFRITVPFWARWSNVMLAFAGNLFTAVYEAAITARWIVAQFVPALIHSIVDPVVRWLTDRVNDAREFAQALANSVIGWARDRLNEALDFVTRVRDWASAQLNAIIDTLNAVVRRVGELLGSPERLAAWAAGAMFWALLRVADSLIEPIVEYVWARRQTLILRTLSRIEAIIAKVL